MQCIHCIPQPKNTIVATSFLSSRHILPYSAFLQFVRINTTRAHTAPPFIPMVSLGICFVLASAIAIPSVIASSPHSNGTPSGFPRDATRRSQPSAVAGNTRRRNATVHNDAPSDTYKQSRSRHSRWSSRHSKRSASSKRRDPLSSQPQQPVTFNIFSFETATIPVSSTLPTAMPEPSLDSSGQSGVVSQGVFGPLTDGMPSNNKVGAIVGGGVVVGLIVLVAIMKLSYNIFRKKKEVDQTVPEELRRSFSSRGSIIKSRRSAESEEGSRRSWKSITSTFSRALSPGLRLSSEKTLPSLPCDGVHIDETKYSLANLVPPREPAPAFPPPEPPLPLVPTRYVDILLSRVNVTSHKHSKSQAWATPVSGCDSGKRTSQDHKRSQSAPEKGARHSGEQIADYWDVVDVLSRPNSNGTSLLSNSSSRSSKLRNGKVATEQ